MLPKNRDKHIVDRIEQLLSKSIGDVGTEHVAFEGLVVLVIQLVGDSDHGSGGGGGGLENRMWGAT